MTPPCQRGKIGLGVGDVTEIRLLSLQSLCPFLWALGERDNNKKGGIKGEGPPWNHSSTRVSASRPGRSMKSKAAGETKVKRLNSDQGWGLLASEHTTPRGCLGGGVGKKAEAVDLREIKWRASHTSAPTCWGCEKKKDLGETLLGKDLDRRSKKHVQNCRKQSTTTPLGGGEM